MSVQPLAKPRNNLSIGINEPQAVASVQNKVTKGRTSMTLQGAEMNMKIQDYKDQIDDLTDEAIKNEYLKRFRKEVDFHHKVAYRFEKSYRLSKNQHQKRAQLNMEIIDVISEHSDYIELDTTALFYCLFFCIYYNNSEVVEFLRTLISNLD